LTEISPVLTIIAGAARFGGPNHQTGGASMVHRFGLRSHIFATSSVAVLGAMLAGVGPAAAQEEEEETSSDRVVVTGSRIQRQDYTANSPIVTVDAATFENTSTIGIETVLNQLPQFVPALTQFTSQAVESRADNTPGASTVNLRGLGSQRNLVLLDGRRAMPVNASMSVDTNSIPPSAIQRVEIISGGASAVYGADAVGGVVNFILKDDFEGLEIDTRYGMTELGDGEEFSISALVGANVANGRGNVMIGMEHSTRSTAPAANRDWRMEELQSPYSIAQAEFWFSETYWAPTFGNLPSQAAVNALFAPGQECTLGNGNACTYPVPNSASFFINPTSDGTGTVFTGGSNFFSGSPGQYGAYRYDGGFEDPNHPDVPYRKTMSDGSIQENQPANYLSLPLERYSMFGKGEFEVTEDVTAFFQSTFARTKTDTLLQYSPATGNWSATIPVGSEIYGPSLDASAITGYDPTTGAAIYDPMAATLPAYTAGGVYGLDCPATGGCTESQAFPLPPELVSLLESRPDPNADIPLSRNLDFLPPRQTHNRSTNFQVVAGLEGELANEWVWDVSLSHGQSETVTVLEGFASLEAYQAIAQSPNFGRAFLEQGNPPSGFAAGTGSCTSGLPLVEDFEVSQDCIDAISVTMQNTNLMEQNVVEANLAGDLFQLPAGIVGFAAGATYRENNYEYNTDILNQVDNFVDQPIGLFAAGSSVGQMDVGEVYGELLVPILSDLPGIEQLNLEIGGRYSDYSSVGGVATYKALVDWSVTDWARFRGGYNRATRAPNIAELFLARTQQAFGTPAQFGDPCSQNNSQPAVGAHNSAQALAICQALMGSTGAAQYYDGPISDQTTGGSTGSPYTRGNPDVQEETADTWTAGLVLTSPLQNPWLSGLSATVDYYRIEISDVIASQGPDAIYQQCFESGSADSAACDLIVRDPITGNASTIDLTFTNEGWARFSGFDVQMNWAAQFEDIGLAFMPGGMSINSQVTIPTERKVQASADAEIVDYVGTLGCGLGLDCSGYDYQIFTTFNYFVGPWSASLRWQHKPSIDAAAVATDPDSKERGVWNSYNLFALSGSYRVNDTLTVRAGVENLLDNDPPLSGGSFAEDGGYTTETAPTRPYLPSYYTGGGDYDSLGRRYWVGLNASF
jgi:outer membrane receptor protein involved in Fe transport